MSKIKKEITAEKSSAVPEVVFETVNVSPSEAPEGKEVINETIDKITQHINIIAIILKNYSMATYSSHSYHSRNLKTYRRGQIIYDRNEILELKEIDAPIKIYCEVC